MKRPLQEHQSALYALGVLQFVSVLDGVGLVLASPVGHLAVELGDETLQLLLALLLFLQLLL